MFHNKFKLKIGLSTLITSLFNSVVDSYKVDVPIINLFSFKNLEEGTIIIHTQLLRIK